MVRNFTDEEKQKYCKGFKNCTLPISTYADKMKIDVEDLKLWLKDYKEPAPYGKIDASQMMGQTTTPVPSGKTGTIKFESETIKLELKENYDKVFLSKLLEVIIYAK